MIINSSAKGDVAGNDNVGGLVGSNYWGGEVETSYALGTVTGDKEVGGLLGYQGAHVLPGPSTHNSYARGDVDGDERVGGLIGYNNPYGRVDKTYSTGEVDGVEKIGGLVGEATSVEDIDNSFWDVETSNINESMGGRGKTTVEMKDVSTYTNENTTGLEEPWDFVGNPYDDDGDENIWNIDEEDDINDGYPFLTWEYKEYIPEKYELTVHIEGKGSTDPPEGTHEYEQGEEVTVEAVPDDGWKFVEWEGDYEGTEEEITITMDDDKEVTAVFEEMPTYELLVNVDGEGEVDANPDQEKYEHGTEVDLHAIPDEGWEFIEWEGDYEGTEEEITITMDDDKEVTAVFEELEPEFEITDFEVDPVEGKVPLEVQITAEVGNVGGAEGTITLETNDVEINSWTLEPDDNVSIDEKYTFEEEGLYYVDLGPKSIAVNVDDVETYTLDVDIIGEGEVNIDPDRKEYEDGTEVTIEAIPDEGWTFEEWTGDEIGTEPTIDILMDEDKEITAVFEEKVEEYELTINIEGEGNTDPEEGTHTYEAGEEVIIKATAADNWYFKDWTGDQESENHEITITMDENITLTATFKEIDEGDVVLTIKIEGEGGTDPVFGDHIYEVGEDVTIEATPEKDWRFEGWTGDHESDERELTITLDEDTVITANFEREVERYTLTIVVQDEDGNPLEGAQVTVNENTIETDEEGEAVFKEMELGTYDYTVEKEGYEAVDGYVNLEPEGVTESVALDEKDDDDEELVSYWVYGVLALAVAGMILMIILFWKNK